LRNLILFKSFERLNLQAVNLIYHLLALREMWRDMMWGLRSAKRSGKGRSKA
jgi:hypothetical protein